MGRKKPKLSLPKKSSGASSSSAKGEHIISAMNVFERIKLYILITSWLSLDHICDST